jgi:hypothetical protein
VCLKTGCRCWPRRKRPELGEAALCSKVQWPRDNVLQLSLSASIGWNKRTDKLGHENEKRSEGAGLLAPAVGLEPSWEHAGSDDSVGITPKGVFGEASLNPSEYESWAAARTRVPDSGSIGAILVHARLAWGAMRVI